MGYELGCEIRVDGQTFQGTAVLEQKTLVLRGAVRVAVPLASITSATADDGLLRVRFGDRVAALALGAAAAKWARRIANPPSRLDKLGVKPGMRVLIVGAVEAGFLEELRGAGAAIVRRPDAGALQPDTGNDLVFYAIDRPESLDSLPALVPAMLPDGALWTLRVKGGSGVSEADTMAAGKRAGLVDVKVVSFSDTLTAEKFVIPIAKRPSAAGAARRPAPSVSTKSSRKHPGAGSTRAPGRRTRS